MIFSESSLPNVASSKRRLVEWIASSLKDLRSFPEEVRDEIGYALKVTQYGGKADTAKPLSRFGSGVMEVVSDHGGNTYRVVYTVRYEDMVYVLHCFQKKSKKGIKTPKRETELIRARLRAVIERRRKQGRAV